MIIGVADDGVLDIAKYLNAGPRCLHKRNKFLCGIGLAQAADLPYPKTQGGYQQTYEHA
jgi:hypothetical protein